MSNGRFATFVGATDHVTDAERSGFSFVFAQMEAGLVRSTDLVRRTELWRYVPGADWRHPDGPGSTVVNSLDHPVVHVSWRDAQAFCAWAGLRLPTESEWKLAVDGTNARRGGRIDSPLVPARWEWTADRFSTHRSSREPSRNGTADPAERRCLRGYPLIRAFGCRTGAGSVRMGVTPRFSAGNIGFRCLDERPQCPSTQQ